MSLWLICRGDARRLPLAEESVQCVVTSPPYWGLRDYGLETLVWGGQDECPHRWEEKIKPAGNGMIYNEMQDRRDGGSLNHMSATRKPNISALCSDCGAWRGSLGLEPTPDLYVKHLVEIFREVKRVLRDDGTVWLNMGDCYHSGNRGGYRLDADRWKKSPMQAARADKGGSGIPSASNRLPQVGLKDKDLIGIPWRVAFALQADAWWLRSDIIWSKPNPMPESVTDRPTRAHEYLFLLTKSARYYYDADAIKEEGSALITKMPDGWDTEPGAHGTIHRHGREKGARVDTPYALRVNKRSIWTIPTHAFHSAHFATFPPALVEICLKAGTSEKGCCPQCGAPWARVVKRKAMVIDRSFNHPPELRTRPSGTMVEPAQSETIGWKPTCRCGKPDAVPCVILDPFAGSGTVGLVAQRLGRRFVGVDLSTEYCAMARQRIMADMPLFNPLPL